MLIDTERLHVRVFTLLDLPAFVAYRRDPEVARYQSWSPDYSEERGREFIARATESILGSEQWVNLAVELKATGELIGDVGLRCGANEAELGFTFSRLQQGKGFAREAVSAVIDHAFARLGLTRVIAVVDARNESAERLLRGLSFVVRERAVGVAFKGELCDELTWQRSATTVVD